MIKFSDLYKLIDPNTSISICLSKTKENIPDMLNKVLVPNNIEKMRSILNSGVSYGELEVLYMTNRVHFKPASYNMALSDPVTVVVLYDNTADPCGIQKVSKIRS